MIQWLRDGLGLIKNAADSEQMATAVPDNGGVYLVPAFVGLGAPYWDAYARGGIQGLTRATNKKHIVRAALESMAYQTADVLQAMEDELGMSLSALRVDGGAAANNFLLQFQSDVLGTRLLRPACIETTAWGAASLAGLGVGLFADTDELRREWKADREFVPQMSDETRLVQLSAWHRAVERSLGWAKW